MADDAQERHWDTVYRDGADEQLGWFERSPSTLAVVSAHSTADDSVIDVGGGDSRMVDELLDRGHRDVTVLELSGTAIGRARRRLGRRAADVQWIHADVTDFVPTRTWDLWHDRAAFHFLTTEDQRAAYRATAHRAIAPDGVLVIATFHTDGPDRCAGLAVARYDTVSLPAEFVPEFDLISVTAITADPSGHGDQRPYVAAVMRRVAAPAA